MSHDTTVNGSGATAMTQDVIVTIGNGSSVTTIHKTLSLGNGSSVTAMTEDHTVYLMAVVWTYKIVVIRQ